MGRRPYIEYSKRLNTLILLTRLFKKSLHEKQTNKQTKKEIKYAHTKKYIYTIYLPSFPTDFDKYKILRSKSK